MKTQTFWILPLLVCLPILTSASSHGDSHNTTLTLTLPFRIYPNSYSISITCRVDDTPEMGDKNFRPRFYKLVEDQRFTLADYTGAQIPPFERYSYLVHHNDYYGKRHVEATLTIKSPRADDSGTIGCDVPDLRLDESKELLIHDFGTMNLTVDGIKPNTTLSVTGGTRSRVVCKVNGSYPLPELRIFIGASNLTSQATFTLEEEDVTKRNLSELQRSHGAWVPRYTAMLELEVQFEDENSMRYLKCVQDVEGVEQNTMMHTLVVVDGVDVSEVHNTTMILLNRDNDQTLGWYDSLTCKVNDLPHQLIPGYNNLDLAFFKLVGDEAWPITRIDGSTIRTIAAPFNRRGYSTYSVSRRTEEYDDHTGSSLTRMLNLGSIMLDHFGSYFCSLVNMTSGKPVILRNSSYLNYSVEAMPNSVKIIQNGKEETKGNLTLVIGQPPNYHFSITGAYVTKIVIKLGEGIDVSRYFTVQNNGTYKVESEVYKGVSYEVMNITITPHEDIPVKPFYNGQLLKFVAGRTEHNVRLDVQGVTTEHSGIVWVTADKTNVYRKNPVLLICSLYPVKYQPNYETTRSYSEAPVYIQWVKVQGSRETIIAVNNALYPGLSVEERQRYKPSVEYNPINKAGSAVDVSPVFKLLIVGAEDDDTATYKCVAPQIELEDSVSISVFGASSSAPSLVGMNSVGRNVYKDSSSQDIMLSFYMRNIDNLNGAKLFKELHGKMEEVRLGNRTSIQLRSGVDQTSKVAVVMIKDAEEGDNGVYILSVSGIESNQVMVQVVNYPDNAYEEISNYMNKLYMDVKYEDNETVAWEGEGKGFSVYCWHNAMRPGLAMVWQRDTDGRTPWIGYDNYVVPSRDLKRYNLSYTEMSKLDVIKRTFYGFGDDLQMKVKDARVEDSGTVYCSAPGTSLSNWVDIKVAKAPEVVELLATVGGVERSLQDGEVLEVDENSDVPLICSAAGFYPDYLPRVILQGFDISNDFQPRQSITEDDSLMQSSVLPRRKLYSGSRENSLKFTADHTNQQLTCDASVPNTRRKTNSTIRIWIRTKGADPRIEIKMDPVKTAQVVVKKNITVTCHVTGLPYSVPIQWRREVGSGDDPDFIIKTGELTEAYKSSGRYNLTKTVQGAVSITYYLNITDMKVEDFGSIICEIPGVNQKGSVSLRPRAPVSQSQSVKSSASVHSFASLLLLFSLLFTQCH